MNPGRTRTSWLRAAWTAEFMAGMVLPVAVVPTAFNSGVNLLYLLGSALLAYMLLAVLAGLYNLSGVYGELLGPLHFEEGVPVRIRTRARNSGRSAAFDVRVRPRLDGVAEPPHSTLARLDSNQEATATSVGPAMARGVHRFDQTVVESPFPIAFMRTQRRTTYLDGPRELVVMPRLLEVDFREAFGTDQTLEGEDILVHGVQGGTSYHGVRPYRFGDPLKHIHWKATARTSRPLVKEFQQPLQARYYLFLDLDSTQLEGEGSETNLEYLIRLAASLGSHLAQSRALYQFVWYDQGAQRVQVSPAFGAGGDLDQARTVLAGLTYHPGSRTRDMAREAVAALHPGNRLVFFVPRDVTTLPDDVAGAGYPSKAIFLVQASASAGEPIHDQGEETGLAAGLDLYRYSIQHDRLDHERR